MARGPETEFGGRAVHRATLESAAGQPNAESVADPCRLSVRHPTCGDFSGANHEDSGLALPGQVEYLFLRQQSLAQLWVGQSVRGHVFFGDQRRGDTSALPEDHPGGFHADGRDTDMGARERHRDEQVVALA